MFYSPYGEASRISSLKSQMGSIARERHSHRTILNRSKKFINPGYPLVFKHLSSSNCTSSFGFNSKILVITLYKYWQSGKFSEIVFYPLFQARIINQANLVFVQKRGIIYQELTNFAVGVVP